MKHLYLFLCAASFQLLPLLALAQLQISFPTSRAVLQRNGANQAAIRVTGFYSTSVSRIDARLVARDGQGASTDWQTIQNNPTGGVYAGDVTGQGGWYNLEVRGMVGDQQVGSVALVERVGIGEVFVIAGQSNAQGYHQDAPNPKNDRVNCVNYLYSGVGSPPVPNFTLLDNTPGFTIAPRGIGSWSWGQLGDLLVRRLNVPVMFFNTAFDGTAVRNWRESAPEGGTAYSVFNGQPFGNHFPYVSLKVALQFYAKMLGVRAVLWHQGETDNLINTETSRYVSELQFVINQSRQDLSKNVAWVVARASYGDNIGGSDAAIITAQNQVISSTPNVFAGPETDNIQVPRSRPPRFDSMHFDLNGLIELANAWNGSLNDSFFQSAVPISASPTQTPPSPTTTSFAFAGVSTVRCETVSATERRLTFTPQYSGLSGEPVTFSSVGLMPPTTSPGPYTKSIFIDNPTVTLQAQQGSTAVSYTYNWLAACNNPTTPSPTSTPPSTTPTPTTPPSPTTTSFAFAGVSTVRCETVSATERRLTFTPQYSGLSGEPVTFSSVGLMPPTTSPGPYTKSIFIDNPTVTLQAQQGSTAVSYTYNWLAACNNPTTPSPTSTPPPTTPTPTTPPSPTTTSFAFAGVSTVRCETVSATERRLTFTPQYSGLSGEPVTFSSVGLMPPTTSPGPYTKSIFIDNPTVTLQAQQGSTAVSYTYNWLAACNNPTTPSPTSTPPPTTPTPTTPPSPTTTSFAFAGVSTVRCETVSATERRLTFTPQYSGLSGEPVTFSSVGLMPPTTSPGPYTKSIFIDNPTVTLQAQQGSTAVSYTYNWLAACNNPTTPSPTSTPPSTTPTPTTPPSPTTTSFAFAGVSTVRCETVSATERRLTFTPQYSGLSGEPVTFSSVGLMPPTTSPGPYTKSIFIDNPTVTLQAQQGSTAVSYTYNWLAACNNPTTPSPTSTPPSTTPTPTTPPSPTTTSFAFAGVSTVRCETVSATERRLTFTPQYSGLSGEPVTFSSVGLMPPTTSPGPYTKSIFIDNPTVTLQAQQGSTAVSYTYNWLAACGGGAPRLGVSLEPTAKLQVKLLGNPVHDAVEVEVTGSENTTLHLSLTDIIGNVVGGSCTERASACEHYRFDVSTLPAGPLLLRTSSQGQSKTVRILKVN